VSKPVLVGLAFVVAIVAAIAAMTAGLVQHRVRVNVCVEFNGKTACQAAYGDTEHHAVQAGISTACAEVAQGVTDTRLCENSQPKSIEIVK